MKFIDSKDISNKELRKLALEECKLLVDYFTKEEVDKLELESIEPECADTCIYGRMTGSCNSEKVYGFTRTLNTLIGKGDIPSSSFTGIRAQYYTTPLEEFIYRDTLEEYYGDYLPVEDRMPNTALIISEIKRLQIDILSQLKLMRF